MSVIKKLIVSGLGTGYLPVAPGSWASLAVCGIFLGLVCLLGGNPAAPVAINVILVLLAMDASVACVMLGQFAQDAYGRKDPSHCTIDEWAGQAISLLLLPLGGAAPQPHQWLIVAGTAFMAFRLFDTIKPPPLRTLEKLPYGWGVLMDDLGAGIYANIASQLFLRLAMKY